MVQGALVPILAEEALRLVDHRERGFVTAVDRAIAPVIDWGWVSGATPEERLTSLHAVAVEAV
jgi:hypothetical protein